MFPGTERNSTEDASKCDVLGHTSAQDVPDASDKGAGGDAIFTRDFSAPTGEDKMDKSVLPKARSRCVVLGSRVCAVHPQARWCVVHMDAYALSAEW